MDNNTNLKNINIELSQQSSISNFHEIFRFSTKCELKIGYFYKKVHITVEPYLIKAFEIGYIDENNPIMNLDFDLVTANISIDKKSKYTFNIHVLGYKSYFKFKFNNEEIFKNAVMFIHYYITRSEGYDKNLLGVSLRKDFYKLYFTKEPDFRENAKTGDLLIFRGFEFAARCQRCFTGAHYDHVALLVRSNDHLCVYESTSKDGVKMRRWVEFTYSHWNLLYDKMVFRRLIINEEDDKVRKQIEEMIYIKTDDFIKETESKKYVINICSLCCSKKVESEKDNKWGETKGFFCSQLVAAAYLKCGIISYVANSGSYLPGAFSKSKKLSLNKQFSLSPEIIIDFSK